MGLKKKSRLLSFPVKSAKCREKFEHLMFVGDYYHNISVLESGRGQLIVLRCPTKEESVLHHMQPKDYTPCPGCLGFVKKCDLWRHTSKCKDIEAELKKTCSAARQASHLLLCQTTSKPSSEYTSEVTARMISDHITEVASADLLITQLGIFMFRQYGLSQRQLISSRIRMLSRLLIDLCHSTKKSDLTLRVHIARIFQSYHQSSSAYLPDINESKCSAYFKMQPIFCCQNWPWTSQVCRISAKYGSEAA